MGMIIQNQTPAERLKQLLESYSDGNSEFWAFRDRAIREHTHVYFQYPAMMVPQMQGQLIEAVREVIPSIRHISDPFVGSGTTMTEAMMQGLDFTGQDINPLAILICRAKIGPFYDDNLQNKLVAIINAAKEDQSSQIDVDFPGLNKWFQQKVAIELSHIRRSIQSEQELWCRRFCWIALAETVRLTSNSRTSTFKLHIRPKEEIKKRETDISPVDIFEVIAKRNLVSLSKQKNLLEKQSFVKEGLYQRHVEVRLRDSAISTSEIELYDLLVTSPPYGDNLSTVPYGQHSYLPLQWIDLNDIDENVDSGWLRTTREIDRRSLGGSLENALEATMELRRLSKSFGQIIEELKNVPRDRRIRVAAFCRDLNNCIDPILASLKPDAFMIWTVGNRRVGGRAIPVDQILKEFLELRGATLVTKFIRTIPTKRMALRNSLTPTMRSENILIMKKGNSQ